MRLITTVRNQTIFDIALQEYGTVEAAFQIIEDNPHLSGLNDFPAGVTLPAGTDFNISYPIREGVTINLQDELDIENTTVKKDIGTVIS